MTGPPWPFGIRSSPISLTSRYRPPQIDSNTTIGPIGIITSTQGTGNFLPWRWRPQGILSTNCLYYNAYLTAGRMAQALGIPADPLWAGKLVPVAAMFSRHFSTGATGASP